MRHALLAATGRPSTKTCQTACAASSRCDCRLQVVHCAVACASSQAALQRVALTTLLLTSAAATAAVDSAAQDCWAQEPAARPSMNSVVTRLEAIKASGEMANAGGAGGGGCCCTIC